MVMAAMAVGNGLEQVLVYYLSAWCVLLWKYQPFTLEVAGQVVHAAMLVPADIQQMQKSVTKMT